MRRIFRITLVVAAMFFIIFILLSFTPQETRTYTTVVKQVSDPSNIYSRGIITDEARIEVNVVKHDNKGYLENRYDLVIAIHNIAEKQYQYVVNLDSYGQALIHDSDDVKITCVANYAVGENQNGRVFVPSKNHAQDSNVGELKYLLRHNNRTVPEVGLVQITIRVIEPTVKSEIEVITHQISFVIE